MTFSCRICGHSHALTVLDLGPVPPVNTLHTPADPITFHPLHMVECAKCGFWQLKHVPPRAQVFPDSYPYRSRTTKELHDNFVNLHASVVGDLPDKASILDIGGNDGTLLHLFQGHELYNVEPTDAGEESTEFAHWIKKFWGIGTAEALGPRAFDLILCTNVFAHADDLHNLTSGIALALAPAGTAVIEVQNRNKLVFDTIYHEHVAYYDLQSLYELLLSHGLYIQKWEFIPTHGGSIRVYINRRPMLWPHFNEFRKTRGQLQLDTLQQVHSIQRYCAAERLAGRKLWGIGAPSRATTLLHYTGLHYHLSGIAEVSGSPKVGLNMPGTRVPVMTDQDMLNDKPDVAIILSWHLGGGLVRRLRSQGFQGQIVMPLPTLQIC